MAVAKATGVYPATFRERVVPAEKPANPLFLFCAPGRSPGRLGEVRWSGGLSRRPNGSRTVQPPSRWRVPQTANPGRLPCQGPPYLAVARQRPQTDIDISNKIRCGHRWEPGSFFGGERKPVVASSGHRGIPLSAKGCVFRAEPCSLRNRHLSAWPRRAHSHHDGTSHRP